MRALAALAVFLILAACGPAPPAAIHEEAALPEWYPQAVAQLNELNQRANAAFANGKSDNAAALIREAQSLQARVLSVRQPTLEGAEAAADVDDLYGRMLLANRHYAWAQMFFQKNRSRWKNWTPKTPETERRFKLAGSQIAECEKGLD